MVQCKLGQAVPSQKSLSLQRGDTCTSASMLLDMQNNAPRFSDAAFPELHYMYELQTSAKLAVLPPCGTPKLLDSASSSIFATPISCTERLQRFFEKMKLNSSIRPPWHCKWLQRKDALQTSKQTKARGTARM